MHSEYDIKKFFSVFNNMRKNKSQTIGNRKNIYTEYFCKLSKEKYLLNYSLLLECFRLFPVKLNDGFIDFTD